MSRPTIGVTILVKDEVDRVKAIHENLKDHVDAFYILASEEKTEEALQFIEGGGSRVKYSKWMDDFANARNINLRMVKTDYWLWIDSDDIVSGVKNLRDMVADMQASDTDIMYFPYHYDVNELGDTVILQWRERLIRTSLSGKWFGAVHETFIPEGHIKYNRTEGVQIVHKKTDAEKVSSQKRNHDILLKLYNKKPRDPRDTHYLALSYLGMKDFSKAIELFKEHIQTSGWDEEQYRSWLNIANAHCQTEEYKEAIQAALAATQLLPHFPDAYFILQEAYYALEKYAQSIEWHYTAMSKPEPETNMVTDPTVRKYRARLQAATAFFCLGEPQKAFKLAQEVKKVQPDSPELKQLMPEFTRAYYEAEAIDRARWLASYAQDQGGSGAKILEGLPPELQMDVRLRDVRAEVIPPKKWPEKSIAFYCGPSFEEWGPDTLESGMSGSEEAVTYLSRELTELGWSVTVFNERGLAYSDPENGVLYMPWTTFNPTDEFDVFIAWRQPSLIKDLKNIKARMKAVDLHDAQPFSAEDLASVDRVFVKSNYHREISQTGNKAVVASNGIVREQFA